MLKFHLLFFKYPHMNSTDTFVTISGLGPVYLCGKGFRYYAEKENYRPGLTDRFDEITP